MMTRIKISALWWLLGVVLTGPTARAQVLTLDSAPPVVVRTVPEAGRNEVDAAGTHEIRVTFSKAMLDHTWSWAIANPQNFPPMNGEPRFDGDRTCLLPVKLEPGKTYAVWVNTDKLLNFKDAGGRPAVPYLLVFRTKG